MPLAGGFLADERAVALEKRYPLHVHVCATCGLVQILDPIQSDILFQDYSFSSSTIKPLVEHFEAYSLWLRNKLQPKSVLEFGCNDGVLLLPLQKLGIRATGVDISRNISEIARGKGLNVITGYFGLDLVSEILQHTGRVDVVTGSNAFPHNDNPGTILQAAKRVLTDDGHICLEVMYAGDLLEQLQWDTLYHEHLTFYSLYSLSLLLRRYGFHLRHAERLKMHGGSLRVSASVKSCNPDPDAERLLAYEQEIGLAKVETWERFAAESRRKIDIVAAVLGDVGRNAKIWAYGAAGKATMWINACNMNYLGAVVDASPLRAGKLVPGTHTRIVLPEEFKQAHPDYTLVTAWNYGDLIRAKEGWYRGTWCVPLPDLRFY
jgi:novobiocin biosynthesis protein NovU/D-mycarose 3-C-methyltransferase